MKKVFFGLLGCFITCCTVQPVLAQKLSAFSFGHQMRFDLALPDSLQHYDNMSYAVPDDGFEGSPYRPFLHSRVTMKSPIMLGVKLNPLLTNYQLAGVKSFSKTYSAYRISDNSNAYVVALGITKKNVNDYRYRVVVNDSAEVVHWSKIKLVNTNSSYDDYGSLGNFNYPDKQILVEVINIKNYHIRDGIIFDWRKNLKPIVTSVRFRGPLPDSSKGRPYKYNWLMKQAPHTIKYDQATNAPTDISFFADSVSMVAFYVKEHEAIGYDTKIHKINNGKKESYGSAQGSLVGTEFDFNFDKYPPGDYEIVISPQGVGGIYIPDQQLLIRVKILPNPVLEKKASLKELLPYLVTALLVFGVLFLVYRRRANIKLARSIQAKQNVNLKLRSIRSQLNPHFMFNALTSIQNLVNKKDMDGANHYLSRFADLTRKVLNTGEHDLISLDDEINILDDYLQMEQLRFNFKYDIKVDANLNRANIDVPAMLLQPFVENAVKHGVANLREKGLITLQVKHQGSKLMFMISDNGPGFKQNSGDVKNNSFGLKLTEERIELLNQVYKDQPVILNIQTAGTGTIITITLTNWI